MVVNPENCQNKRIEVPSEVRGFLRHILGMSALDIIIYAELCNSGCATVEALADVIGKDRSTIYKSLKNLVEKGFVRREVRILRKGGYKYIFVPVPPKKLEKIIQNRMNACFKQIMNFIEVSSII